MLTLLLIALNYWASIPTLGPELLPAYEPNQYQEQEVEINEPWIIVNEREE